MRTAREGKSPTGMRSVQTHFKFSNAMFERLNSMKKITVDRKLEEDEKCIFAIKTLTKKNC